MRSKEYDRPPIGTLEEEIDPISFAKMVAAEYATMENGYHAQLRAFLQKAYHSYQLFLEFPDAFEKLKRAPFWKELEAETEGPDDLEVGPFDHHAGEDFERSCPSLEVCEDPRPVRGRRDQSHSSREPHKEARRPRSGVQGDCRRRAAAIPGASRWRDERRGTIDSSAAGVACLTQRRRKSSWRADGGRNEIGFRGGYGKCARRSPADVVL